MKKVLIAPMILGVLLLSGCATEKDIMLQEGHSLAYANGFEDGCHSGKKAGGNMFESFRKDEDQFSRHRKYAQGWSDGFRQCENEQEALDRQVRMSMEQEQLNEQRKRYDKMNNYYLEKEVLRGVNYDAKTLNRLR